MFPVESVLDISWLVQKILLRDPQLLDVVLLLMDFLLDALDLLLYQTILCIMKAPKVVRCGLIQFQIGLTQVMRFKNLRGAD